eukprot:TRINITY_DN5849_c0_g1_i1.p1 TRINITY_DN5849_c0_g1~~TRINITY_DN5849_c0_g1_i1.p1  ORF type:complete len:312 (+),score=68.55 TRINITY_DN5849_c0_g1_i1:1262-2197(+)
MTALIYGAAFLTMGCIEVTMTIFALVMVASVKSSWVRTTLQFGIRPTSYSSFICIAVHGLASLIFCVFGSISGLSAYLSPTMCNWIAKMVSATYLYVLLAFFTFLYLKCQAVNVQGEISKHLIDHLIKGALLSIPVVFTPLFLAEGRGVLYAIEGVSYDGSSGHYCYFSTKQYVVALTIVADISMNVNLTLMFRRPLMALVNSSQHKQYDPDGSHARRRAELRKILEETLFTSVCGLTLNFIAVLLNQFPGFVGAEDSYKYYWMKCLVAFVPVNNSFIMLYSVRNAYEGVLTHHSKQKPKVSSPTVVAVAV